MSFIHIEKADIIRVTSDKKVNVNEKITITPMTPENINDGLSFNTQEEIDNFKKMIKNGHKGYYAYYDGKCAFRTFIFTTKDRCLVGSDFIYDLPEEEYFSAWSKTNPDFYKLGLYTASLKYAIDDNPTKTISAYVDSKNIPSLKGTIKVGFETMEKYTLIVFLGKGFKIKTFDYKTGKCWRPSFGRTIYPRYF